MRAALKSRDRGEKGECAIDRVRTFRADGATEQVAHLGYGDTLMGMNADSQNNGL
jgi:hypothetical protein